MTVSISFFTGANNLNGSGLNFFGAAGAGANVPVGSWNARTFVGSADGSSIGPEGNNCAYLTSSTMILGAAGSGISLQSCPNAQATLRVCVTSPTPINVVNSYAQVYDSVSTNNPPSGVVTKVVELIHPDPVQNPNGSGSSTWSTPAGTGVLYLATNPGLSGLFAGNGSSSTHQDIQHDFYLAISQSPSVIGQRFSSMLFYLEYL